MRFKYKVSIVCSAQTALYNELCRAWFLGLGFWAGASAISRAFVILIPLKAMVTTITVIAIDLVEASRIQGTRPKDARLSDSTVRLAT